jgi:peptidoglycan/xylan/chitin deacetylase (PgdA/CDA1 family)
MNYTKLIQFLTAVGVVSAQSFCSSASHSGQSVTEYSNTVGSINGIGYELWADSGSNSATFYSDGSFSCSFQNAKDYLCRSGLSFDSTQTYDQIGHMYADFKLVKQNIQNVDYSFVGVYGWTRNPLIEFYIVDNWLSQYRPGDWVGDTKHGDYTIDGAQYTVYENTRYGPSIDGDTQFKQYFSIRQQARDCGTIDITAHFQQWEKLGMRMGNMHEAKVLGEAGSNGSGTSGTADFPYAKVYIGNGNNNNNNNYQQQQEQQQYNNNQDNGQWDWWNNWNGNNNNNNNYQQQNNDYNSNNAVASSYPKGSGFQFYTQCKNRNHWALTYDDGPTQYADSILDLLKKYNIKATFFLVGDMYIKSYDSEWTRIVQRMYNEGHVIGSHTYSHNDLTQMSSQQIIEDMQKLEDAVYNAIGKRPAFMRPPYGTGNGNQNVMSTLQNFGMTAACTWYVDPMDWDNGGNIAYAKQEFSKLNGEGVISLNHLQYNGATAQGIIELSTNEIELMLAKGYTPVTMEECLGMSAYK